MIHADKFDCGFVLSQAREIKHAKVKKSIIKGM